MGREAYRSSFSARPPTTKQSSSKTTAVEGMNRRQSMKCTPTGAAAATVTVNVARISLPVENPSHTSGWVVYGVDDVCE